MEINYIGLNLNGWEVKKIEYDVISNRNRTFLICECENCKKEKRVRADKRKNFV